MFAGLSFWIFLVLVCGSSVVCGSSEGLKITAEPGENVILTCKTGNDDGLIVLEWNRDGLGDEAVFLFRDGRPFLPPQHESYKNRVFLKDSQMKDGDLSVVLKNVTNNDSGTYKCKAKHEHDPQRKPKLISTIRLSVDPPDVPSPDVPSPDVPSPGDKEKWEGDQDRKKDGGINLGVPIGIVLSVLVVLAAVVSAAVGLVGFWIYRKKKGSNQSSSGSSKRQRHEW